METLTNSGASVCAAISPDGKSVAHVEKKDGMQQLIVTDLATKEKTVIVTPEKVEYRGVTFSPDGYSLYITNRRTDTSDTGTLYQVARAGGPLRRIKDWVDSPIAFSPNGHNFAFVRSDLAGGEYSLIIAGTDGMTERMITKRGKGDRLSLNGPAWSPDGNTIVYGAGGWDNKGYHMNLIEFDLANNQERTLGDQNWFSVEQVAWLEDRSGLTIIAREQPMSPSRLWRIPYPQGHAEQITNDPADYRGVSSARDSNMIVSVQSQRITKIWTAPDGDAQRAKAIAPVNGLAFGLDWTVSGKIVFSSMAGNHLNISVVDPDGSNQIPLTNAGDNYTPATSPDGRFIVFTSNRTGGFNIWRMNAEDGSDLKQLTFGVADSYPSCSADSQWVFYDNQSSSRITVWKVPIDGGEPVQLTTEYARMPVVSPDNQFMACRYYAENGQRKGIAIIPVRGGPPLKVLTEISGGLFQRVQWMANGHALTFINAADGVSNIWSYNLDDGSKQQLTHFKDDQIFTYAWSPDNKQLACERGAELNNVITLVNQK
jgi:Tol biopolymer transport system component